MKAFKAFKLWFHEPLLHSKTKISKQKRFRKKPAQSQREKKTRAYGDRIR